MGTGNNVRLLRVDDCNNENEILIKFHGSFGLSWLGRGKLISIEAFHFDKPKLLSLQPF